MNNPTTRVPWLLLPELSWRRKKGAAAILTFQDKRLKQLFRHAYENVPFYRRTFNELGLTPRNFRGLRDLHKIPVGDKSDISAQGHQALVADGCATENLLVHCTSGTSGRPLRIARTWHEERMLQLLRWKAYRSYGWHPFMKRAKVDIPSRETPNRMHENLSRIGLLRIKPFSCFEPAEKLILSMAEYDPDTLAGYPENLAALARTYSESDWPDITPHHICCGGGLLTQLARDQIEKAFPGIPVYDVYGCTEFNLVAWQCPETGRFQVCQEGMILEVLDEHGNPVQEGESGQIVGTALHSFAMPLLRIPLGDTAVKGPEACPHGTSVASLSEVSGRLSELFTFSGGRTMHPFLVLDPLDTMKAEWLYRYRLVQAARDHLVLELVARPQPGEQEVSNLQVDLSSLLPDDIRLDIRFVHQMPQESSGKFRLSIPLPPGTDIDA